MSLTQKRNRYNSASNFEYWLVIAFPAPESFLPSTTMHHPVQDMNDPVVPLVVPVAAGLQEGNAPKTPTFTGKSYKNKLHRTTCECLPFCFRFDIPKWKEKGQLSFHWGCHSRISCCCSPCRARGRPARGQRPYLHLFCWYVIPF